MDYYLSALRMAQGLNQTLIKTSTGVWSVTYNAENRPVRWERGNTIVTMDFDRMGRRVFYKEEVAGEVVTHHKFVYDNYLCVQKLDALNNNSQMNLFVWDPTEPIATRPLFMLSNPGSYKFFYTFDGNKNVSELVHFESRNGIAAHYDYAPFGAVTRAINNSAISDRNFHLENPFRFSSEYHDDTLGLVYYNYRHYNPVDGRWCGRDPAEISRDINKYSFVVNNSIELLDTLGLTYLPESCPSDIANKKIYSYSFLITNDTRYVIYDYRTNVQRGSITTNGCSVPWWVRWTPGMQLHIAIFTKACNNHDICYGTCGSKKTNCDNSFLKEMMSACDNFSIDVGYRTQCKTTAWVFYFAVLSSGKPYYDEAQDAYCERKTCSMCYDGRILK